MRIVFEDENSSGRGSNVRTRVLRGLTSYKISTVRQVRDDTQALTGFRGQEDAKCKSQGRPGTHVAGLGLMGPWAAGQESVDAG